MSERSGAQAVLWIVQGPDVVSGKLARTLVDNKIRQVQQVAADTIVLSMTADSAERLKAEFPDLIVEANSDLKLFG